MLKKSLLVCFVAGMALVLPAEAQILRESASEKPSGRIPVQSQCIAAPPSLSRFKADRADENSQLRHAQPKSVRTSGRGTSSSINRSPAKAVNLTGVIQGYLSYSDNLVNGYGWYSGINTQNRVSEWEMTSYRPYAGFVKDDVLYTFYHTTVNNGQAISKAGYRNIDLRSGEVLSSGDFDIFNGYDKVVLASVYDSSEDKAYVITYNTTGSAIALQELNLGTMSLTKVADMNIADWPTAMAYCPADGAIYCLMDNAYLEKLDKKTGKLTSVGNTGYPLDEYIGAMVYSPVDDAFVAFIDNYDQYATQCVEIPLTGNSYQVVYTCADSETWSILYNSDTYKNPEAPDYVTNLTLDYAGGSLSGSISFEMPVAYGNGQAISTNIYASVTVDGSEIASKAAAPGAAVSVSHTMTEGIHQVTVTPFSVSGNKKLSGPAMSKTYYFGIDTPASPESVTLTETLVEWTAVTKGENGGYIDVADVKYNVYIDDQKVNPSPVSQTSLSVTMPSNGQIQHYASVEAVAGGKTSQRTLSNSVTTTDALALPCYIAPEEGQRDLSQDVIDMFTPVDANKDGKTWLYDRQNPYTGGFYYLASSENDANDWLILPAMIFPDASGYYKLQMQVGVLTHYFASNETFEIGVGPDTNPANMHIVSERTTYSKQDDFYDYELVFQVPDAGINYIGIHAVTPADHYRLYARNFRVSQTQLAGAAPAVVSDLSATPKDKGRLLADVSFNMPLVDITGSPLPADVNIDAVIKSPAQEIKVSGLPGSGQNVTIATVQGDNSISVATLYGKVEGQAVSVTVHTGVDIPGLVEIDRKVSEDNLSVTLSWTVPTDGENGGYVDPDACTYTIYRYLETGDTWMPYVEVGTRKSWTFDVDAGSEQKIYQFGILAESAAGKASSYATVTAVLGTPYTIPMSEKFDYKGENVLLKYEPFLIENLTELYPDWSFADPEEIYNNAANNSGIALCAYYIGSGRISLPKFSTENAGNVKVALDIYFGPISVDNVTVLASCDDAGLTEIASFSPTDGDGWENKVITLPARFLNKKWVSVSIEITNSSYSRYFMLDRYEIKNYPDNDMCALSVSGDSRADIGDENTYVAVVENYGSGSAAVPQAKCEVLKDGTVIKVLDLYDVSENGQIAQAGKVSYTYKMNVSSDMQGACTVRFGITGSDDDDTNNTISKDITVYNGNIPVVDDLCGEASGGKAELSWSEAKTIETVESMEPWSYGEYMRNFRNVDLDGKNVYGLEGLQYNGKFAPKAFQMIDCAALGSQYLNANSGDCVLLVCAPTGGGVADDWLISPEIVPGSDVSFYMNVLTNEYGDETITLLASSTDDEPDLFSEVVKFSTSEREWKLCTATLPDNAKYFALRYSGTSADKFAVIIDDISYMPADPVASVTGYNIYRNEAPVAYGVSLLQYVDDSVEEDSFYQYNVTANATIGGTVLEGDMSNPCFVTIENSGADDIITRGEGSISTAGGMILLDGFAGQEFALYDLDGRLLATAHIESDHAAIPALPGAYIAACGDKSAKIIVR